MRHQPHLLFHFRDPKSSLSTGKPIFFHQPIRIISADTLEDVLPAIREVEKEVTNGYYAAGFLTYEAAQAFNPLLAVQWKGKMPYVWFGIFEQPDDFSLKRSTSGYHVSRWKPMITESDYYKKIRTIKHAIASGLTYQVNYTLRLQAQFAGNAYTFYEQLLQNQNGGYSAFLHTDQFDILSVSPELFFYWDGNEITTRPMKGTTKRGKSYFEDIQKIEQLRHSKKDQAENAMIVDLLRNDLSHIAERNSVQVSSCFDIEKYWTVYQMTSTITAQTKPATSLEDIFQALFPCGSITGAPKQSTMKLIAGLESSPREVYCGAIGYMTPEKEAIFNVPIRTVIIDRQTQIAEYSVGGGITWDSSIKGEYEEALTKATVLTESFPDFSLLESIRRSDGEWYLLDRHLKRLKNSADYFGITISIPVIKQRLQAIAEKNPRGIYKVRLLVDQNGTIHINEERLADQQKEPYPIRLARSPISKENRFLYHKTTYREMFVSKRKEVPDAWDVLLWNEAGELTEFTIGNLVVELDGKKWTPPVSSGLLAGTFREELLAKKKIKERVLTKEDLKKCTRIWLINSVRGWIEVTCKS